MRETSREQFFFATLPMNKNSLAFMMYKLCVLCKKMAVGKADSRENATPI